MSGPYDADLELARACAAGDEQAWDRFVRDYRPILYRAADALDSSGRAREVADSLYAELYGLRERDGQRRSLFAYFRGRSSLATWLRAVLAQRYVDELRSGRRADPLPDDAAERVVDPQRPAPRETAVGVERFALLRRVLVAALASLAARDRLRLACYYRQDLTLAETGRLLGEHEATVSRQLARSRRTIRSHVERALRVHGLDADQIAELVSAAAEDAGPLDLGELMADAECKKSPQDRSV